MGESVGEGDKGPVDVGQNDPGHGDPGTSTLLQNHYVGLLERLLDRKMSYQVDPQREEWLLKAINRAAYSAFRSCVEYGAEAEARDVLGKERQPE